SFLLQNDPLDDGYVQMFINGTKQLYTTDYVGSGKSITYIGDVTLDTDDKVEFWYLAIGTTPDIGQEQVTIPVVSSGQTSFILPTPPFDDGYVQMYINGLKQQYGIDYYGIGTSITYTGGVTLDTSDDIEFWYLVSPS